ncbi:MAG: regulatory protein RecX [Methylococcales bacterium]|nr:regulatory protein RecX [Methylococcales bacterium]
MNPIAHDIKDQCLRLLTRREHSQKELLTKLMQKGFERADIQPIIDELAQQNWQSDERFVECYARYRFQKGFGEVAIRYELSQKGIDVAPKTLDDILLTIADDWLGLLSQVYFKKYGEIIPISHHEWSKRSRFLLQRGFSSSQITQFARKLRFTHS